MFNNIIYFIVVLLIFTISYPDTPPEDSFLYSLLMLFLTWAVFAVYCKMSFGTLLKRGGGGRFGKGVHFSGHYQRLNVRLSVLAICLFALDVYLFNLKYWLIQVPGLETVSLLQGMVAVSLFLFYLSTIWYFGFPAYKAVFEVAMNRRAFILSNLRFNVPILFPWIMISLVYDVLALTPWTGEGRFLNTMLGQILFFAAFIMLLMSVMPKAIQYWWGCRPLPPTEKGFALESFLHEKGFKYRRLLRWPIFEGRMMTAGIMGIVPRYRYVLVTDALLEYLSVDELKAVLAHEMGHAKYKHLFFYILFFVGFMALSMGLSDLYLYFVYSQPFLMNLLSEENPHSITLFYLFVTIPMLLTLLIYFRFIMGFFMRHFERQADLYSAELMGTPTLTVNALEKIALLSGKIRDVPSWHHFSIRQRVDCLWQTLKDPGFIRRYNRFVLTAFIVFLVIISSSVYVLNFGPVKTRMTYALVEKALKAQIRQNPADVAHYLNLAMVYQELGKDRKSMAIYDRIIERDPKNAIALNNLAWLLVTSEDRSLRDAARGVVLARRAVAIEPSSGFLDTLAEAYYRNGESVKAITTIKAAISRADRNREYYERQLKKFSGADDLSQN